MSETTKKQNDTTVCTDCFKSLGTGSRMKIYTYLHEKGPETVSNVVKIAGLRQPTVSYHLRDMEKKGLLSARKSGKEVYYSVNDQCRNSDEKCVLANIKFPVYQSRVNVKNK
jgi:DNA-binding transcriptional ArsR family regulator